MSKSKSKFVFNSGSRDHLNESFSDRGGEGETTPARTRLRDRPPIIDEDDDDMMLNPVENVVVDRERDVNLDENSLYYIMRHSKSAIAVNFWFMLGLLRRI